MCIRDSALGIDQRRILIKRCLDMNDRALRNILVGLGGKVNGVPREDGFIITVASEVMALSLIHIYSYSIHTVPSVFPEPRCPAVH